MTTNNSQSALLEWTPVTGFVPPIFSDEPQNGLIPECVDAVMAELNPRAIEQLRETSSEPRIKTLLENQRPGYVRLRGPEVLKSRNYEGR